MFKSSNLTLMVRSLDQAIEFYVEKLGLSLKARYGEHWAEVQAPGLTIGLHPAREEGEGEREVSTSSTPQPKLSIGFEVEDLEQAVTLLQNKGLTFTPELSQGKATRTVNFSDPDQTPLYLYQTLSTRPTSPITKAVEVRSTGSKHLGALEENMIHIKPPVVAWPPSNTPNELTAENKVSSKEVTPG